MSTHRVYLQLGANIGECEHNMMLASQAIEERIGYIPVRSSIYKTQPWGKFADNQVPVFYNQVLCAHTTLSPEALLSTCQAIERSLGKAPSHTASTPEGNRVYASRLIDIDILFYDQLVLQTPTLTIPHCLLHKRTFVLEPLCEIAPTLMHPLLKQTVADMLKQAKKQEEQSPA